MSRQTNFDSVARIYRWSEYLALGPLLERTRTRLLPQLAHTRNALVLGDGDGRFLAALLARNPQLHAVAVDTSAAMLRLLLDRCNRIAPERIKTIHASVLDIGIPPAIDLVTTHFLLDCLTQAEVERLATNIAGHTGPGTLWLLSDFGVPSNRIARPFAQMYIRALYFAFRVLTGLRVQSLPDPQTALERAGFTRVCRHQTLAGLIYTELWQRK